MSPTLRRAGLCFAISAAVAGCGPSRRRLAPIRMQPVVTLGDDSGDGAIGPNPQVSAPMADGARIVIATSPGVASAPMVFGPEGKYLGRLRGGRDSASTFASPLFTRLGPGDSIWVFDGAPRVLVFDRDRIYRRSISLPFAPWDAIVLSDGRLLLSPSSADRPLPMVLLTATGAHVRTIGDSATATIHAPRWLVRGAGGTFWSMPTQYQWRLEHWDSSGRALTAVSGAPDWFAPYTDATASDAPQPTVQGLWSDAEGKIWILGQVADAHWTRAMARSPANDSAAIVKNDDERSDTMVQVLDPSGSRSLLVTRLEPWCSSFAGPATVLHLTATQHGWKHVELLQLVWGGAP